MGSAGDINGCELTGNTAIVDDPANKLVAGGGLSVRNADISLSTTRIGPSSVNIGPDSNVTSTHCRRLYVPGRHRRQFGRYPGFVDRHHG